MALIENRRTACHNCPFRKDENAIALAPGRLDGIVRGLYLDDRQAFFCHKTTSGEEVQDDDGNDLGYEPGGTEKECMGAVAYVYKQDGHMTVNTRINLHLGRITLDHIKRAGRFIIDSLKEARTCR